MAKLDALEQVDFLQKVDDVGSRDLRKDLLDGANIETFVLSPCYSMQSSRKCLTVILRLQA